MVTEGGACRTFCQVEFCFFPSNYLSVFTFISDLMYFLLEVRKVRQAVKLETWVSDLVIE